jgi:hypothetical protein
MIDPRKSPIDLFAVHAVVRNSGRPEEHALRAGIVAFAAGPVAGLVFDRLTEPSAPPRPVSQERPLGTVTEPSEPRDAANVQAARDSATALLAKAADVLLSDAELAEALRRLAAALANAIEQRVPADVETSRQQATPRSERDSGGPQTSEPTTEDPE